MDCFGEIHSLGYNLIGDRGGCVLLDQKDDILGVHAIVSLQVEVLSHPLPLRAIVLQLILVTR